MNAPNAVDAIQMVPTMPNDSHGVRLAASRTRNSCIMTTVSAGRIRDMRSTVCPNKPGNGMDAITAERNISAGNMERTM